MSARTGRLTPEEMGRSMGMRAHCRPGGGAEGVPPLVTDEESIARPLVVRDAGGAIPWLVVA